MPMSEIIVSTDGLCLFVLATEDVNIGSLLVVAELRPFSKIILFHFMMEPRVK